MPWREIGAILVFLVIVFLIANLWFHIVEGALRGLKRLFFGKQEPPVWHPLPPDQNQEKDEKSEGKAEDKFRRLSGPASASRGRSAPRGPVSVSCYSVREVTAARNASTSWEGLRE